MAEERYVDLPGSERAPHPGAEVVGAIDRAEPAYVVVALAPGADPAPIEAFYRGQALEPYVENGVLKLRGTAGALADAFQVHLDRARAAEGQHFRQRTGSIRIPAQFAGSIVAVLGLDNRPHARSRARRHPQPAAPKSLTPQQAATLYNYPADVTGSGVTIGICSLGGGFATSDLQAGGIDPSRVTFVSVDNAQNNPAADANSDGENMLDLTVSLQADGLSAKFFEGPNTDAGMYDCTVAALADADVVCVSWSWGSPTSQWTQQSIQAFTAVLGGITKPVFVASGDSGPTDGTGGPMVNYPASDPNATGVGGTRLEGEGTAIASEVGWDDSREGGGAAGGGFSTIFPRPSWQTGSNPQRGVPDIALNASPETGYSVTVGGKASTVGGTSAAAPMAARGYALLIAKLGKPVFPFNSAIYAPAAAATFNIVTQGINGEYAAGPNQAPGAGLGSFNLGKLELAL